MSWQLLCDNQHLQTKPIGFNGAAMMGCATLHPSYVNESGKGWELTYTTNRPTNSDMFE